MNNSLFSKFGVELEYMIVSRDGLDVRPIADEIIYECSGSYDGDVDRGEITWSNELAAHVIELKTTGPVTSLDGLAEKFQREVVYLNKLLAKKKCRLLPSAMHPWMDPARETKLWAHGNQDIYRAFDRIFNCSGHGWSNLQSVHLNLPFADENEFVRLHTAIRVLLPLLPALAASSPFVEGRKAPAFDYRLEVYRHNCKRIPIITGQVIPEAISSIGEYHENILQAIYQELKPHDPENILQEEWANARGAITRFERNTIEIRVLDIQECPAADLAVLQLIIAVIQGLTKGELSWFEKQVALDTGKLAETLLRVVREGENTVISDPALLSALKFHSETMMTAKEIWQALAAKFLPDNADWTRPVHHILEQGTLATRILKATGNEPDKSRLREVYQELSNCLNEGIQFAP